jgi:hypothetical protein
MGGKIMALVFEFTVCSLCGGTLDRAYKGLSEFMGNLPLEIMEYGDSVMHMDCFEGWEHRLQFSQESFRFDLERWSIAVPSIGYILLQAENYLFVCGPATKHTEAVIALNNLEVWEDNRTAPSYTHIYLRDWDLALRSHWVDWEEFLEEGYKKRLEGLSEASKAEIEAIVDDVRKQIPDMEALWAKLREAMAKFEDK